MISVSDLQDAIAECLATPNPNASTCAKLASFYVILDHMAMENKATEPGISYTSDSEFCQIIKGKPYDHVVRVIDELMQTLQAVNPRLYDATLNKLV